ncbi:MAG: hypothetical protein WCC67_20700, partial [Candidatus Acidiferrales bacterium]
IDSRKVLECATAEKDQNETNVPRTIRQVQASPGSVAVLSAGGAAPHEMHHEQNEAQHEGDVNKSGRYVESEKSKQPKNNQNCGDNLKHVFTSLMRNCTNSMSLSFRMARMPRVTVCVTTPA